MLLQVGDIFFDDDECWGDDECWDEYYNVDDDVYWDEYIAPSAASGKPFLDAPQVDGY